MSGTMHDESPMRRAEPTEPPDEGPSGTMMPEAVLGASGGEPAPMFIPDAPPPDAPSPDTGVPEAATPDANTPDFGTPDAGTPDTGTPDAITPDVDEPVLAPDDSAGFRDRWHEIQATFVDDPHRAVEDADRFVTDVAQAVASGVERRRRGLTSAWEQDGHEETEELRLTMRQYRVLVDRILQV